MCSDDSLRQWHCGSSSWSYKSAKSGIFQSGCSAAEAAKLDADIESLCRAWLRDAWPFRHVAFPGRGDTPWPVFETLPFRDEAVPRIGADALTVIDYNARACGLARC